MKTVCAVNECCGCMLCSNVCGKQAVTVQAGASAYNAVIDETKCVHCNLCHQTCPQNEDRPKVKPLEWYQGWAEDPAIRQAGSSGGLATAIALAFVREGGCCVSCTFAGGRFVFRKADNEKDVLLFRGSKYVKSNPEQAYQLVKEEIGKHRKVLFIGLPCQVAGMKAFAGSKGAEYLYTIDLICHGSPSPEVLRGFLRENRIDLSAVTEITFRKKTRFLVSTNNRPVTRSGGRDLFMAAFLKKLIYTDNCYQCKYATLERCADLTLGDSWGSELPQEETTKGVSLVLCQTEKGRSLLNRQDLHLESVDLDKAVAANTNLSRPSTAPAGRELFFKTLREKNSYQKAFRKVYPKLYFRYKLKELIRRA